MTTSIKITALSDIGTDIDASTIVPVVNMVGSPVTEKATLQQVGNLILEGAGSFDFSPASQAINAETVSNAAQPAITSVGTLVDLQTTGNLVLSSNLSIEGNTDPLSATDTSIAYKIPITINGNVYYIALTATQ